MYLVPAKWGLIAGLALAAPFAATAQSYDAYGQPPAIHRTVTVVRPVRHRRARRVVVVRHRPFSHSVAIVGGSALAGAGVGALVGGGPGAIVGGLTGGVGGLIYDRKTHRKRRVVIER